MLIYLLVVQDSSQEPDILCYEESEEAIKKAEEIVKQWNYTRTPEQIINDEGYSKFGWCSFYQTINEHGAKVWVEVQRLN